MNARFEEGFGHWVVHVVGCDNGYGLDAIRALGFCGSHFGVAAVGAIRRDVQVLRGGAAARWIRRQRGGNEFVMIVHARGDAVHRANERAGSASHHAQSDAALSFTCACA